MPTAMDRVEAAEARLFADLGLDVERRLLTLGDVGVDVRLLATGSGDPVVLLTGEGLVASSWAPLLAELRGVRAIAAELPGFGGSSGVSYRQVDLRRFARRVVGSLLDALELDAAVLVGSSAGGAFALWAAAAMPARVRALGLLGCPAPAAPRSHLPAALVPVGLLGLDRLLLDLPLPPFPVQRRAFRLVYGAAAIDAAPVGLLEAMHHAMDRPSFARAMTTFAESAYGVRGADHAFSARPGEFDAVTMPTLLAWGDHDRYGGTRVARRMRSLLPAARLELLAGGHAIWLEHPTTCAALLRDLLATADRASTRDAASGPEDHDGG